MNAESFVPSHPKTDLGGRGEGRWLAKEGEEPPGNQSSSGIPFFLMSLTHPIPPSRSQMPWSGAGQGLQLDPHRTWEGKAELYPWPRRAGPHLVGGKPVPSPVHIHSAKSSLAFLGHGMWHPMVSPLPPSIFARVGTVTHRTPHPPHLCSGSGQAAFFSPRAHKRTPGPVLTQQEVPEMSLY